MIRADNIRPYNKYGTKFVGDGALDVPSGELSGFARLRGENYSLITNHYVRRNFYENL